MSTFRSRTPGCAPPSVPAGTRPPGGRLRPWAVAALASLVVSAPLSGTAAAASDLAITRSDGATTVASADLSLAGPRRATSPRVRVYGRPGSFGSLGSTLPGGLATATVAVDGWSFLPGQAAFTTVVAPDGTLLIANEPQTDVQTSPTAATMAVTAFHPATRRFTNVTVPTTAGATSAVAPGSTVGGADIGGIAMSSTGTPVFVSSVPYHGWDLEAVGQYPSIGTLARSPDGSYRYAGGLTGDDAHATAPEVGACPYKVVSRNCNGLSDLAPLPGGGFVAGQYFGDTAAASGSVLLLDDDGRPLHRLDLPLVRQADGRLGSVRPRLVTTSPVRSGVQHVAVVSDVTADGVLYPGVLTELSVSDGRLARTSEVLLPHDVADRKTGYEFARYDRRGDLWVSEAVSNTLTGGLSGVYPGRSSGQPVAACRQVEAAAATVVDARRCTPAVTTAATSDQGLVRSMVDDPRTGDVVVATLSGYLQALRPVGYPVTAVDASAPVDLGLGRLVDRERSWVGPRMGAVDPVSGTLYVPVQQLQSPALCSSPPCPPRAADQWVYGVDLVSDPFTFPGGTPRPLTATAAAVAPEPARVPPQALDPSPSSPAGALGPVAGQAGAVGPPAVPARRECRPARRAPTAGSAASAPRVWCAVRRPFRP